METAKNFFRKFPWAGVILIGAIVRCAFLIEYISSPEWDHLLVDSLFHSRWAASIADGNIIGNDAFFRAPLYIYFLGLIYSIFGKSILIARIFGAIIGLLSTYFIYKTTDRIFSKKSAIISSLLFTIYPSVIYFESELLVDSLFALFFIISVYYFFKATDSNKPREFLLLGMFLGLAAITRPVVLALFPIYILFLFFKKSNIKHIIITLLFLALTIIPVTIRNYIVAHDTVLIASSGGINFYIGNNYVADGLSSKLPGVYGSNWTIDDIDYIAESESGRQLSASEKSNYWYRQGMDWIAENKADFLALSFKKLYYLYNNQMISNNRDLKRFFSNSVILTYIPLNFSIILLLAVIGLVGNYISAKRSIVNPFILALIIAYTVAISLFFINERFRIPMIPLVVMMSSSGFFYLYNLIINKTISFKKILPVVIGVVALALSLTNFYTINLNSGAQHFYNLGNVSLYNGDYQTAASLYRKTISEDPYYPNINLNLGACFLKTGELDSARYYFANELSNYPERAECYSNLASIAYLEGNYSEAVENSKTALKIRPYSLEPYIIILRSSLAIGDTAAIERVIQSGDMNLPDPQRLYYEAGLAYSQLERFEKSFDFLERAYRIKASPIETDSRALVYEIGLPYEKIKALSAYQIGYLNGIIGKFQSSIEYSSAAIEIDSSLSEAYINLVSGYLSIGNFDQAKGIIAIGKIRFPENPIFNRLSAQIPK